MLQNLLLPLLTTLAPQVQGPPAAPPKAAAREIRGIVTHKGARVGGAEVLLSFRRYPLHAGNSKLAQQTVTRRVKTNDKGEFELTAPAWRWLSLRARKGSLVSSVAQELRVPVRQLAIEIGPGWTVAGQLTYRRRSLKKKIAFRLERALTTEHAVPIHVDGTTDTKGAFRVENLPQGPWRLVLRSPERRLKRPFSFDASTPKPVKLPLARALTMQGQLLREDGKPLARRGASIRLQDVSHAHAAETGDRGLFTVAGLQKGPGATLLVAGKGIRKALIATEPGLNPRAPAPQIRLRTKPGLTATGRIVDSLGNPAAGIDLLLRVYMYRAAGFAFEDLSVPVRTDAEGRFRTDALDPRARYEMLAIHENGEPESFRFFKVDGPKRDLGTMQLGSRRVQTQLTLAGGIVDADLEVRIYGPTEGRRDHDHAKMVRNGPNSWISPSLAVGSYCVMAVSKLHGISRFPVKIAAGPKQPQVLKTKLTLRQVVRFQGVVHRDGKPQRGLQVACVFEGGRGQGGLRDWTDAVLTGVAEKLFPSARYPRLTTTDKDGKFSIWCIEASGRYDIVVEDPMHPEGSLVRISNVTEKKPDLDIDIAGTDLDK